MRSRDDFGAIILLDSRYSRKDSVEVSPWMKSERRNFSKCSDLQDSLCLFYEVNHHRTGGSPQPLDQEAKFKQFLGAN